MTTITKDDLFRAVLAMDVYHRGYNAGLTLTGSQIGTAPGRRRQMPPVGCRPRQLGRDTRPNPPALLSYGIGEVEAGWTADDVRGSDCPAS